MILAALQLALLLVACDGSKTPAETTGSSDTTASALQNTDVPVDTSDLSEAEKRALVDDELPDDVDLDGRKFVIVTMDTTKEYYIAEDQTGVALNDAIYAANLAVAERFGISFSYVPMAENNTNALASQPTRHIAGLMSDAGETDMERPITLRSSFCRAVSRSSTFRDSGTSVFFRPEKRRSFGKLGLHRIFIGYFLIVRF